jgi:hypothetical protein
MGYKEIIDIINIVLLLLIFFFLFRDGIKRSKEMKNYVLRRDHKGSVGSIFITVVFMMGALAAMAIIGGVIAIVLNVFSPTEIDFWGVKITTGHVGVAFAAMGLLCMMFILKRVLKYTREIASLLESRNSRHVEEAKMGCSVCGKMVERKQIVFIDEKKIFVCDECFSKFKIHDLEFCNECTMYHFKKKLKNNKTQTRYDEAPLQ